MDYAVSSDLDFDVVPFTEKQPLKWDSRSLPYGRKDKKTIGDILDGL